MKSGAFRTRTPVNGRYQWGSLLDIHNTLVVACNTLVATSLLFSFLIDLCALQRVKYLMAISQHSQSLSSSIFSLVILLNMFLFSSTFGRSSPCIDMITISGAFTFRDIIKILRSLLQDLQFLDRHSLSLE